MKVRIAPNNLEYKTAWDDSTVKKNTRKGKKIKLGTQVFIFLKKNNYTWVLLAQLATVAVDAHTSPILACPAVGALHTVARLWRREMR